MCLGRLAVDRFMQNLKSLTARYHSWTTSHAFAVLMIAAAITCTAGFFASHLKLKTAFSELLPSDDPGVIALNKTQQRMGDLTLLLIGIHSPDPQANERYAEMLTKKVRELPKGICQLAAYNLRDTVDFFSKNKLLYLSEQDLETLHDRLKSEIAQRKNPLLVSLDDDEESLDSMRKRMEKKDPLSQRFPDGLFTDKDRRYLWVAALPAGGLFAEHAGEDLWKAARQLIADNPPSQYHPQMTAFVGGPIATAIANRQAVERDILWVTVICVTIVALSIALYFRRIGAILLIGFPGVAGTMLAFAVADLTFGYLNSSTAFLGSIIIGNGINYAIVFLSRYDEHRLAGESAVEATQHAMAGVWRATGAAAMAASAAYASLMITSFRGFYQFGVMGAVGSIACWLSTFTILPAILRLTDRRQLQEVKPSPFRLAFWGESLGKAPRLVVGISVAVTLSGIYGAGHFLRDPFEYDFRKLSVGTKSSEEAQKFSSNLDSLFGRWPSPTVVLADSPEEAEAIRQALRRQDNEVNPDAKQKVLGDIVTIADLLPGTPEVQNRKLAILSDLRHMLRDPALDSVDAEKREELKKLQPPDSLHVLSANDLSPLIRRPFTEVDGTIGRVLLVYPPEKGFSVWDGKILLRIAKVTQEVHLPNKVIETSGFAVVFGAMIRSVLHDGPIATAASLAVVLLIGFLTVRPATSALLALGTLLLGVTWMIGFAGLARVHVTFLNFIALPITFGIGAEYAINIVSRYQENKRRSADKKQAILRAVGSTGSAVALCSWTTIVGYGSLLAASNRALKGFGAMAILGEIACLSAAIFALPTLLIWLHHKRG